ncbi:MAG: hypothetical protein DRP70_16980 [Spirochaetes bacterium]|nr:MAG: hypothetical protein DRP70_16980 [Spirochaetota bacterium]
MKKFKFWLLGLLIPATLFAGVVYYGSGEAVFLVDQIKMNLGFTTTYTADEAYLKGTVRGENFIGGINNYITNSGFEINADGWNGYKDAADERPVDGTGGSSDLSFFGNLITPLRGTKDFRASLPASSPAPNNQGNGFSYDFKIDQADLAKVLRISFDYTSTSDEDLFRVYIYDIDNSQLIEPVPTEILAGAKLWQGEFQTSADGDDYRLIIHVQSTDTGGHTAYFDNFFVGPQEIANGPIITEWVDGVGYSVANVSAGTIIVKERQVAENIEVDGYIPITSGATGNIELTVPKAMTNSYTGGNYPWYVKAEFYDNSTGETYVGSGFFNNDTNKIVFTGPSNSIWNATVPVVAVSGDQIQFHLNYPAEGFEGSAQLALVTLGRGIYELRVIQMLIKLGLL